MSSLKIALIVLGVLAGSLAFARGTARIRVRADAVIGPVNRLVMGNNMLAYQDSRDRYGNRGAGVWDPERRRPVPVYVDLAKACGLSVSRWPGGCGAHRYNWKKTVGPLRERPDMKFGLPEFLAWCDATGSEPILTIAVYWGGPQDAADLVEYLNAPNDGGDPNGGTDWARLRAADGHPEPYRIVWFEYGNESYHGNHGKGADFRKCTPEEYARGYLEYRRAMKAVDPSIKLGALIQNGLWEWNRKVLEIAGPHIDFGIEHTYLPAYSGNEDKVPRVQIALACLACDAQLQRTYDVLNEFVREHSGRAGIAWAITEYNGHFVQQKPVPYRQCLANALRNAEHLRVMMRPRNRIALANFWQFSNEYWGMVRGYTDRGELPVRQANYFVYELYHRHFGDVLIEAEVECGTFDFEGAVNVRPRRGAPSEFRLHGGGGDLLRGVPWELRGGPVRCRLEGDTVVAEFPGEDVNFYHPRVTLRALPGTGYRVTGWIRTLGLTGGNGAGFQVGDARGWGETRSCQLGGDVRGDSEWTKVIVDYVTLPDADAVEILARRLGGGGPVSGRAMYRLERVERFDPENLGAVPYVSCNAAKRADGTVTLMLVNKDLEAPAPVRIELSGVTSTGGGGRRGIAWSLTGPSPVATNLGPEPEIGIVRTPVERDGRGFRLTLPPCSLTAVEIAQ